MGFTGAFGEFACLGSLPALPRRWPPPCCGLRGQGARGGLGAGKARGQRPRYRAAEGGCAGEVPPRCRDLASPGAGRAPAPLRTSSSMDRPGAQPGPAQAEPARPPPALPPPPPPPPLPAAAPRAANMAAAAVGRDTLPEHWSYGVCRDGRVFFIKCGAGKPGRGPGRGGRGCGPGGRPRSGGGANRCTSPSPQ